MKKFIIYLVLFLMIFNTTYAEEDYFGRVYLEGEKVSKDVLKIKVMTEEITNPILGVAFHLNYSDSLDFLEYRPGDFLERGGDPIYMVDNREDLQKIIFGATLRKDDGFPVNNGMITEMYFQVGEGSKFRFDFDNNVMSTINTVRQDLDKVLFEGALIDFNSLSEEKSMSLKGQTSVLAAGEEWNEEFNEEIYFAGVLLVGAFVYLFWILKKQRK